ncbi:hypothetical protein FOPE_02844 [Fonsecaea pedrosoi]|nr:hypothetical protein FOPE_02844 [Fonsecaea pedrosoi]
MAHEFDYFADVLRATRLIVFMGTPHRGSQVAAASAPLATFTNLWLGLSFTSNFTALMRLDLISMLSRDSAKLDEVNQSFKRRAAAMTIISCYERVIPPGCSKLEVVEKQSAILRLPEEIEISIQADHMTMCRFSSRNDSGYEPLARAIVYAVKQMMLDTSYHWQILSVKKDVVRQIKVAYSSGRHEYVPSFETLWHVFEMTVRVISCARLYIVIDALDECEEKSRLLFLAKLINMIQPRSLDGGETWCKRIKLIISGQPLVSRAWKIGHESLPRFYIDMEKRPESSVEDLQRFVDYKVEDLVDNAICSEALGEQLKRTLPSLARTRFSG